MACQMEDPNNQEVLIPLHQQQTMDRMACQQGVVKHPNRLEALMWLHLLQIMDRMACQLEDPNSQEVLILLHPL